MKVIIFILCPQKPSSVQSAQFNCKLLDILSLSGTIVG